MRKTFILSILVLCIASGLTWAQFWKDFSDTERQSIAEAYWLAGNQYQATGQPEKGAEYRAMARNIFPSLDPASIADRPLPSAAELLAQGRAVTLNVGSATAPVPPERAPAPAPPADPSTEITKAFTDLMGAILSKDADRALSDVGPNVRFLRLRQTVTKEELKTSLLGYFDNNDFASSKVSDAVDLSSIFVEPADSPVDGVSGDVYALNVKAAADLTASIPFWGDYMKFWFVKDNGAWVIFAVM